MRILHTSDWHLGRITDKEPRFADHVAVLAEIVAIARNEAPDVIIHSGDLFDHPRPSYKDMVKASEVLRELAQTAPVVVICGNHDSPDLFRFIASWLGPDSRIRFVDRPVAAADGGILNFVGADGVELRLAVLPYVHPNRIHARLRGRERPAQAVRGTGQRDAASACGRVVPRPGSATPRHRVRGPPVPQRGGSRPLLGVSARA